MSSIIKEIIKKKKNQSFRFAARRTVVRHSKLALLPQPTLTFEKVHAVISAGQLLLNLSFFSSSSSSSRSVSPASLPDAEMALTAETVPTRGLRVHAELVYVSLFAQHLLWDFNCVLAH